jgi:hypothetical protein
MKGQKMKNLSNLELQKQISELGFKSSAELTKALLEEFKSRLSYIVESLGSNCDNYGWSWNPGIINSMINTCNWLSKNYYSGNFIVTFQSLSTGLSLDWFYARIKKENLKIPKLSTI